MMKKVLFIITAFFLFLFTAHRLFGGEGVDYSEPCRIDDDQWQCMLDTKTLYDLQQEILDTKNDVFDSLKICSQSKVSDNAKLKKTALLAAKHGLLDETRVALALGINIHEKDSEGKPLFTVLFNASRGRLSFLKSISSSYLADPEKQHYELFCRECALLVGDFHDVGMHTILYDNLTTFSTPLLSLITQYAAIGDGYLNKEGSTQEDDTCSCIIM